MNYNIEIDINKYNAEEPVPSKFIGNYDEIQKFLLQSLICPYPTITEQRLNLISSCLYDLWLSICEEYSLDSESNFVYYHKTEAEIFLMDEDLELELYPTIIRIRRWIHLAEAHFHEFVRPFLSELATEGIYSKHFSINNYSVQELSEMTKHKKPSKFLHRPNNQLFKDILDLCNLWFFYELLENKNLKIAVECEEDIGVDEGRLTKYLLMEIDIGSKTAHCRPIRKEVFDSDRFDRDLSKGFLDIQGHFYPGLIDHIRRERNGLRIQYSDKKLKEMISLAEPYDRLEKNSIN